MNRANRHDRNLHFCPIVKQIDSMIDLPAGKLAVLAPAILIASKSLIAWAWGREEGTAVRDYPARSYVSESRGTTEPRRRRSGAFFCAFREMRFNETISPVAPYKQRHGLTVLHYECTTRNLGGGAYGTYTRNTYI